jgi:HlyD family secretion protein
MTEKQPKQQSRKVRRWPIWLAVVVVLIALGGGGWWLMGRWGDRPEQLQATFDVQQGPLTISVIEAGTISNREKIILKSEVPGRNAILSLVDEGTTVDKGDLLVELDASSLKDQKDNKQIELIKGEAALVQAREALAVTKSQASSDLAQAELDLKFARGDLSKYEQGDYPQQLQQAETEITLAREELSRAEDRLDGSQRLYDERYITLTELKADQLAVKKARLELALAERNLKVLQEHEHPRMLEEYNAAIRQAEMALERAKRKTVADVVQAEADLKARQSEYKRQQEAMALIEERIAKCRITAPVSGMVVYATTGKGSWRGNKEPLAKGQEVTERQELIHLPTTDSMQAEIKIHESNLRKVKVGLPATIRVDALPGRVYRGVVGKIALYPDAQMVWLNPDLKVYSTEVNIEGDTTGLRAGMTCRVEILVQELDNAVYVPVQTVVRIGSQPTVFLVDDQGVTRPQPVEVGMDNGRMIHITSGLAPGQHVLLSPPLDKSAVPLSEQREETPDRSATSRPGRGERTGRPGGGSTGRPRRGATP